MGLAQLPDEVLLTLSEQWQCRDVALKQLSVLLSSTLPRPSNIVIYGPRATGKTGILSAFLQRQGSLHAIVQSRECITGRHLLERTAAAVYQALRSHSPDAVSGSYDGRCESISTLAVHLERCLRQRQKFTLVFDGIDRQREASSTLLPALARLGETIPSLTVVFIVRHPAPRFLHRTGLPHIHFPCYTRDQSIHILSRQPPDIFLEPPPPELRYDNDVHDEDKAWLWPRYCAAVWDSLAQNSARDLVAFRDVCDKLWRPFVAPIIKGDFGTRNFSRLLVAQRRLFQDESVLLDSIIATPSIEIRRQNHQLPYYAKWLLIAAYLASFNPVRLDTLYFMKSTERKRRKKGGGTARSAVGRPSQNRKIPRHLLPPSIFTIDRLLAILHAILPHDHRSTMDIYAQIATLASLRLLIRGGGIGSSDPLETAGKWRVGTAVGWDYVLGLARSVDFGMVDYIAE